MRIPGATYRLQLGAGFGFREARALLPYLDALGITDLYLSPIAEARAGSTHGYDVTDPTRLNPELGDAADFDALVGAVHARGMGILLDVVPNHMAASVENRWWRDVLENGQASPYARFFDITWHPAWATLKNRVLLPILAEPYGRTLEAGEFQLRYTPEGFIVEYRGLVLPVDPRTYPQVLGCRRGAQRRQGAAVATHPALNDLIAELQALPARTAVDPESMAEREAAAGRLKERLHAAYVADPVVRRAVDAAVRWINGRRRVASSVDVLDHLLADQAYWLAYSRTAGEEINYRRFFALSDLVGVRAEDPQVFAATHALMLRLVDGGRIDGLRIDHVDGLHDPVGYLRRLQAALAEAGGRGGGGEPAAAYVVVEKILSGDETLPEDWPVAGTTGYDFLNLVAGLFVDHKGLAELERTYARFTGVDRSLEALVHEKKRAAVEQLFAGDLRALEKELVRLAKYDRHARDLPARQIGRVLLEVTAALPVYRTYTRSFEVAPRDRGTIERALESAAAHSSGLSRGALDFMRRVLLLELPARASRARREATLGFVMRWQQLTGPAMAKGLEDTAFYIHNPLVSLNEVGGGPQTGAVSVAAFHRRNRRIQARWPGTLNATSTHDTKRSEDVRARIHVLSELPAVWGRALRRWHRWNGPARPRVGRMRVPTPGEEVLVYQTLLGAWPLGGDATGSELLERLDAYFLKAIREAKEFTDWIEPDEAHEAALRTFVHTILDGREGNRFLPDFLRFQRQVAFYGAVNSLSQTLLKLCAPGVPDLYQGTELWDLSLVDPDNRRPVDFRVRARLLEGLPGVGGEDRAERRRMLDSWEDGCIKLFLTRTALWFRREHAALFQEGRYLPLRTTGRRRDHVVAFARWLGADWALVAAPRLATGLCQPGVWPTAPRLWGSTAVVLPADAPTRWCDVFTGREVRAQGAARGRTLRVSALFAELPFALLAARTKAG